MGDEEVLDADVEKAKQYLTDDSYNKAFAEQIKCQEQQVQKGDFIARFHIELKGKIPYQPRNIFNYGGAGRGRVQNQNQTTGGGTTVFATTLSAAKSTPAGGGRPQWEKKPCTCEDTGCVEPVPMGNIFFCPKFKKLDVIQRKQYLWDSKRCYDCGEPMSFNHKSNCKQKERNNCKANHPATESKKHNWMLCPLRAQELGKTTNVKMMELNTEESETVLKMMSEEDDGGGIEFDLMDFDDEGGDVDFTVMMTNVMEENPEQEEQKHPFEGVIETEGGYNKSKYNVKETLNKLLSPHFHQN